MTDLNQLLTSQSYTVRKKIFSLLGHAFHVFDANQNLVFYSKMKGFKLKEDVRIYSDESMATELLSMQARNILDFSGVYDVTDSQSGQKIGILRRHGFKSMFLDEWSIQDASENLIATLKEDNIFFALIRRFVTALIPQTYRAEKDGQALFLFRQNFNPFVYKLNIEFEPAATHVVDKRLILATAIMLAAIEGKQE